jgi:hypothetical protein
MAAPTIGEFKNGRGELIDLGHHWLPGAAGTTPTIRK